MSRGRVGAVGNDAASSAQSKRAGGGETACLGPGWGELGHVGSEQGAGDEWGVSTGVDGVVSDAVRVRDAAGVETARLRLS
jgi:hypothetical protein